MTEDVGDGAVNAVVGPVQFEETDGSTVFPEQGCVRNLLLGTARTWLSRGRSTSCYFDVNYSILSVRREIKLRFAT